MSGTDPMGSAQALSRAHLPKRFYEHASVAETGGGWQVLLDGRPVRTPAKRALKLPARDIAEAVASEWEAQETLIDPASMPLTRIANSAIDGVREAADPVRQDIARFAQADLICYRAEAPEGLVARQTELWDPLLDWARRDLGLSFNLAAGVVHVAQPTDTLERAAALLADMDAFALAGLHVVTSMTGSLVIGLALAHRRVSPAEAWEAAQVDEDWQISQWGEDADAMRRRRMNRVDMEAAARFLIDGRN